MEHQPHIDEIPDVTSRDKILAIVVVAALLAGVGGYVVFGSGLWHPHATTSSQ
jgi:hypothetical protein